MQGESFEDNNIERKSTGIVNSSLQKVAKGTSLVFIGTILGMFLAFVQRIILARYYTMAEYGIYSLALAALSICTIISALGINVGSTRQIAFLRGKKSLQKVKGVIISSIVISLIASFFLSLILFFNSDIIAQVIFHETRLSFILKIISVVIPFSVLIDIFTSIFQGFDNVNPNIYFKNILKNGFFLLFLLPVILCGLPFNMAMYAFSASIIVTFILFSIYAIKKLNFPTTRNTAIIPIGKELLFFSVPLLVVSILSLVMSLTDTLMLGYFKPSYVVGLYNSAIPLAKFIPIVLSSMIFIYLPVVSRFHIDHMDEMRSFYSILTKWAFSFTLPLILILFLYPELILRFLFGDAYTGVSFALRVLCLGFFVNTFLGPNGATLTAIGKTKVLMYSGFTAASMNIILNLIFIPLFSINGAAIATASSLILANILKSAILYKYTKIHPFSKNYIKPIFLSVIIAIIIYYTLHDLSNSLWILPIALVLFSMIYIFSMVVTKSFQEEDYEMFLILEKRLNLNLKLVKKILGKFI